VASSSSGGGAGGSGGGLPLNAKSPIFSLLTNSLVAYKVSADPQISTTNLPSSLCKGSMNLSLSRKGPVIFPAAAPGLDSTNIEA